MLRPGYTRMLPLGCIMVPSQKSTLVRTARCENGVPYENGCEATKTLVRTATETKLNELKFWVNMFVILETYKVYVPISN